MKQQKVIWKNKQRLIDTINYYNRLSAIGLIFAILSFFYDITNMLKIWLIMMGIIGILGILSYYIYFKGKK